jgi:hypothetical protein
MPKTYPALKTLIAVAYTQHILAHQLQNTAGQQGYTPQTHNMYNVFAEEDDTYMMDTAMTNIAALTTGRTLTGVHTATMPELVANMIN